MPKGSTVDKLYRKLKSQGRSKGSAAKIAQHATGLSLATGKKPKYKNAMKAANDGDHSVIRSLMEDKA
jgi:hypothetical protein